MGNTIQLRRGITTPTAGSFASGEPGWDAANSKLYIKNNAGSMICINPVANPADDTLVVHIAGTETITGVKTFSNVVTLPGGATSVQTASGYFGINAASGLTVLYNPSTASSLGIYATGGSALLLSPGPTYDNIQAGAHGKLVICQGGPSMLGVGNFSTDHYGKFNVRPGSASQIGMFMQGYSGQTADLLQILDSSLTMLVKIDAAGSVTAPNVSVADQAYGSGWDGSLQVPTKNAIYDKIQSVISTPGAAGGSNTHVQFNSSGTLAGSSNLVWTGSHLTVTGVLHATSITSDGNLTIGDTYKMHDGGNWWTLGYPMGGLKLTRSLGIHWSPYGTNLTATQVTDTSLTSPLAGQVSVLTDTGYGNLLAGKLMTYNISGNAWIEAYSNAGVTVRNASGNMGVFQAQEFQATAAGYFYFAGRGMTTSSANGVIHVQNYNADDTTVPQALVLGPGTTAVNGIRLKHPMGADVLQVKNGDDSGYASLECDWNMVRSTILLGTSNPSSYGRMSYQSNAWKFLKQDTLYAKVETGQLYIDSPKTGIVDLKIGSGGGIYGFGFGNYNDQFLAMYVGDDGFSLSANGLNMPLHKRVNFTADNSIAPADVALARVSAGVVGVYTSATGSTFGSLRAARLGVGVMDMTPSFLDLQAGDNTVYSTPGLGLHQATASVYNTSNVTGNYAQLLLVNRASDAGWVGISAVSMGGGASDLVIRTQQYERMRIASADGKTTFSGAVDVGTLFKVRHPSSGAPAPAIQLWDLTSGMGAGSSLEFWANEGAPQNLAKIFTRATGYAAGDFVIGANGPVKFRNVADTADANITAGNATFSGTVNITGATTFSGNIVLADNKYITWSDAIIERPSTSLIKARATNGLSIRDYLDTVDAPLSASNAILSGDVQSAGKVVIGATLGSIYSGLTKLHVKSTNGAMAIFENTASGSYAEVGLANDGGGAIRASLYYTGSLYAGGESHPNTVNLFNPRSTTNAWLQLGTNNSPRLAITETGLVGINLGPKVSPSAAFHVGTASRFDGNMASFTTGHTDTFTLPGNATAQLSLTNDGGSLGVHHHYYPSQGIDRWVLRTTPNSAAGVTTARNFAIGYLYGMSFIETDMSIQMSVAGMNIMQLANKIQFQPNASTQEVDFHYNSMAAPDTRMTWSPVGGLTFRDSAGVYPISIKTPAASPAISLGSAAAINFSSTTAHSGTVDAKISRNSAGKIGIDADNGLIIRNLAGTYAGLDLFVASSFAGIDTAASNGLWLRSGGMVIRDTGSGFVNLSMGSGNRVAWTPNGNNGYNATVDAALARVSAGVVGVYNTATGSGFGDLLANAVILNDTSGNHRIDRNNSNGATRFISPGTTSCFEFAYFTSPSSPVVTFSNSGNITASGAIVATGFKVGDGSAGAPTYSFTSTPATGMYLSGTTLGLSVAGNATMTLATDGRVTFRSGVFIDFPGGNDIRFFDGGGGGIKFQSNSATIEMRSAGYDNFSIPSTGGVIIQNAASYATTPTLTLTPRGTQDATLLAIGVGSSTAGYAMDISGGAGSVFSVTKQGATAIMSPSNSPFSIHMTSANSAMYINSLAASGNTYIGFQSAGVTKHLIGWQRSDDALVFYNAGAAAVSATLSQTGAFKAKRLGIGAMDLGSLLDVQGAVATAYSAGGLGDASPTASVYNLDGTVGSYAQIMFANRASSAGYIRIVSECRGANNSDLVISNQGTERFRLTSAGVFTLTGTSQFKSPDVPLGTGYTAIGQVDARCTDSWAQNKGGTITLGGSYGSTSTNGGQATFGAIHAKKANASNNDLDGYMAFEVSNNTTAPYMAEAMRITPTRNLLVGKTTDSGERLQVSGRTSLKSASATEVTLLIDGSVSQTANLTNWGSGTPIAYVDAYGRIVTTFEFRGPAIRTIDESSTFTIGKSYRTIIQSNNGNTILFDGGVNQSTYLRSYQPGYPVMIADDGGATTFGGNISCKIITSSVSSGNNVATINAGSTGEAGFFFQHAGVSKWELYSADGTVFGLHNYTTAAAAVIIGASNSDMSIAGSLVVSGSTVTCGVITSTGAANNNMTLSAGASHEAGILFNSASTNKYQLYANNSDGSFRLYRASTSSEVMLVTPTGDIAWKTPTAKAFYIWSDDGLIVRNTANSANSLITASTIKLTTSPTVGYVWKCTNVDGSGSWQAESGGGGGVSDGDKGDITVSSSGAVWTIDNSAVTLAKIANIATATFLGRNTASSGVVEELSVATAKTMLGLTGTNSGDQTITLTGDVTGSGTGSFATTISANAVTFAKMQTVATQVILGRDTSGTGDIEAMSPATVKTMLQLSGTNTGDQTITLTGDVTGSGTSSFAATIANNAVSLAKMATITTASFLGRNTASTGNVEVLSVSTVRTMLSIDNVENTALSTWAGSTNITTVGTIATGTWNATAIADAKIASTLTGKTYNGLTLTAQTTGFTIAGGTTSRTLTVAADANVSGTNTGDQTITLTGDVTGSGTSSFAATIASNAVTLAKFQQIATASILGRTTASTGNVEVLSVASVLGLILPSQTGNNGKVLGTDGSNLSWVTNGSGGTSPAGSNSQIQFNNSGAFGASANLTWSTGSNQLGVSGTILASGSITGSNLSGTNTGDQTITLTGDVTGSGTGSFAATIASNAVTLAKMADIATASFIGRNTASTGDPEVLSVSTVRTMLSISNVENTALSTWAGSANITTLGTIGTGTWNATAIADGKIASVLTGKTYNGLTLTAQASGFTIAGGTTSRTLTVAADANVSGTNTGDQTITLTGDVTGSGTSSFSATIANNAVTLAKFQQIATASFIGRNTASTGNIEVLSVSTVKTMLDLTGTNSGDQTITLTGDVTGSGTSSFSATIANNAVTLAKFQQIATASFLGRNTASTGNVEVLSVATAKSLLNLTGTNSGDQTITLTGDVTGSGTSSFSATIANSAVTNAKMANMAAYTLKGNNTGSSAAPTDLTRAQARAMLRQAKFTMTFASSQTWDLADGLYQEVTLTGNMTLGFPSNAAEGETVYIIMKQDGTGGRTLSLNSGFKTPGGGGITLSTGANDVDWLHIFFVSSTVAYVTVAKDFS